MKKKYSVMIVEDQAMPRQLFEMYVNNSEKYELACSLNSAVGTDLYCNKFKIDLVIMDVLMADGSSGLDAAADIKREHPEIKIIIVTSMPEVSYIRTARSIGVESFWYKETAKDPIMDIMDRTMAGEHVYPDSTPAISLGMASSNEFTERELDILREITTGASNKDIAEKLCLSQFTIKTHVQHLMEKTGLANRTELAVKARAAGLVISRED